MAKKKPGIVPPKKEEPKTENKQIIVPLKIKSIDDKIDKTKDIVREIRTVVLINTADGMNVSLKGAKATHQLKGWDKRMLNSKNEIIMTLSVPKINQRMITEFGDSEEDE